MTFLDRLDHIWATEPVAILGFVEALMLLLIVFGIDISPMRQGAVLGVVKAAMILIARSRVSPAAKGGAS